MRKKLRKLKKRIGKDNIKKFIAAFATIALLASSILPYILS